MLARIMLKSFGSMTLRSVWPDGAIPMTMPRGEFAISSRICIMTLHSSMGYCLPNEFEERPLDKQKPTVPSQITLT